MRHSIRVGQLVFVTLMCGACGTSKTDAATADAARSAQATGAPRQVSIDFAGVTSDSGAIIAVLCRQDEGFPNDCRMRKSAPAKSGITSLVFDQVPEGRYAVAAFHDADGNGRVGMSMQGYPSEGLAFSNDAMGRSGPPSWDDSAFDVKKDTKLAVTMRYWTKPAGM